MKKFFGILFVLLLTFGMIGTASAMVLTFDDIGTNPGSLYDVVDGYGGLNWNNMMVIHEDYHPGSGYDLGVVSGEWAAFNSYDNIATVNDTVFDFNGAYFTSAWDTTNYLTAIGYNSVGVEIYNETIGINNQGSIWWDFGFTGITSLTLNSSGSHFAMDNFTFNETAPVPEPSTILLMGAGLLGLVGYNRRRFSKKS